MELDYNTETLYQYQRGVDEQDALDNKVISVCDEMYTSMADGEWPVAVIEQMQTWLYDNSYQLIKAAYSQPDKFSSMFEEALNDIVFDIAASDVVIERDYYRGFGKGEENV